MNEDCIFCQIVTGQLPSYKIYEDNNFLAFLDIYPFVKGHTLVVPKKHYRWVWDVENIGEYMEVCQKVVSHYRNLTGIDRINTFIFGEKVHHAHIQLLPNISPAEMDKIFQALALVRNTQLNKEEGEALVRRLSLSQS